VSLGRLPSLGSILLLIAGVAILLASRDDGEAGSRPDRRIPERVDALVVEVVDGDTARMGVAGDDESVRYIGIDTPESVIPGETPECFGKQAARLNERLVEDETVRLVFGRERRDQYDRLLAYVYRDKLFVNEEMVRRGFATVATFPPNVRHVPDFLRAQREARVAGRGLWGSC
jgi:micrococcal nuclease